MKSLFKNASTTLLALLMLCLQGCQQSPQTSPNNAIANKGNSGTASQPGAPQTQLKVGDTAPDFSLTDTNGKPVKLSDFRGKKNVTLAFYVLAFTGG